MGDRLVFCGGGIGQGARWLDRLVGMAGGSIRQPRVVRRHRFGWPVARGRVGDQIRVWINKRLGRGYELDIGLG